MSSEISSTGKLHQTQEMMNKRHTHEVRKQTQVYSNELRDTKESNDKEIARVKKDYDKIIKTEANEGEGKLIKVRTSYNKRIKEETDRYEKLLADLKTSQEAKVSEMKVSQDDLVQREEMKHKEYLESARQRFEEEKAKLES